MKKLLFSSFLICYSVIACSAQSLDKHKSLQDSWYYYDINQAFTRVNTSNKVRNAQITLENNYTDSSRIFIQVSQKAFLFINGSLYDQIFQPKSYDIDSLFAIHGKNNLLNIKLYGREPFEILRSEIWTKTINVSKYNPITLKREKSSVHNILILAYVMMLTLLVFIKKNHVETWESYTRFGKILSGKDFTDNLYKIRPFEGGTIIAVVLYSFTGTLLILILSFFTSHSIFNLIPKHYIDSWYFIPTCIVGTVVVFILAYFKYFLVKIFTYIYNLKGFSRYHFYNHLKISTILFIVFASNTFFFYFGYQTNNFPKWLITTMVVAYILKIIFIVIKISSLRPYSIFHLFSYLCTAEILPAIIFVKIISSN